MSLGLAHARFGVGLKSLMHTVLYISNRISWSGSWKQFCKVMEVFWRWMNGQMTALRILQNEPRMLNAAKFAQRPKSRTRFYVLRKITSYGCVFGILASFVFYIIVPCRMNFIHTSLLYDIYSSTQSFFHSTFLDTKNQHSFGKMYALVWMYEFLRQKESYL